MRQCDLCVPLPMCQVRLNINTHRFVCMVLYACVHNIMANTSSEASRQYSLEQRAQISKPPQAQLTLDICASAHKAYTTHNKRTPDGTQAPMPRQRRMFACMPAHTHTLIPSHTHTYEQPKVHTTRSVLARHPPYRFVHFLCMPVVRPTTQKNGVSLMVSSSSRCENCALPRARVR